MHFFDSFRKYPATYFLLLIQLLAFTLQIECAFAPWTAALRSDIQTLIAMGGVSSSILRDFGLIRLLTSGFLHTDIFHLFTNMVALLITGRMLEKTLGKHSLLPLFMMSVCLGSIFAIHMNRPMDVSVGASGGILGITGTLLLLYTTHPFFKKQKDRTYIVTTTLMITIPSFLPLTRGSYNIDVGAHLGGIISGILIGIGAYLFTNLGFKKKHLGRIPLFLTSLCITIVGYAIVTIIFEYQKMATMFRGF